MDGWLPPLSGTPIVGFGIKWAPPLVKPPRLVEPLSWMTPPPPRRWIQFAVCIWHGVLLDNYGFMGVNVWELERFCKDAAFVWSLWHHVVAVNNWHPTILATTISTHCLFFLPITCESIKQRITGLHLSEEGLELDSSHHAGVKWCLGQWGAQPPLEAWPLRQRHP